ncbi:MAG: aspartate dehydrogenase domain-containing protein [Aeromicrobium sp.]
MSAPSAPLRVAILGHGAIGRVVARRIHAGVLPGFVLAGVVDQQQLGDIDYPQLDLDEVAGAADIAVECINPAFASRRVVALLDAGVDVVLCSVGALADEQTHAEVMAAGPGRVVFPTGAIGGLDLLTSVGRFEALDSVTVTTTKLPKSLIQHWMSGPQRAEILATAGPLRVYAGPAREACGLFPQSINIAAAAALAVGDFDIVTVELNVDPAAVLTRHVIRAHGPTGEYEFSVENLPSPDNPRTSSIVPASILHALNGLAPRQHTLLRPALIASSNGISDD